MPLFRRLWLVLAVSLLLLTMVLGLYAQRLRELPTLSPEITQALVLAQSPTSWSTQNAQQQSFATLIANIRPYQLVLLDEQGQVLERFPVIDRAPPAHSWKLSLPVLLGSGNGVLHIALPEQTVFSWWRWWLALAGMWLGLTLFGGFLLRRSLRGVSEVRAIAQRIIDGERDPRALNADSSLLASAAIQRLLIENQQLSKAQVTAIDQVRRRSFVDGASGLGNRAYFDAHLDVLLHDRDANVSGVIFLFDVGDCCKEEEEQAQFITQLVALLQAHIGPISQSILARRDEMAFAALVPAMSARDVDSFARKLLKEITILTSGIRSFDPDQRCVHMGAVAYQSSDDAYHLMAEADMALRYAQQEGASLGWHMFESGELEPSGVMGRVRWRALLERVIEQRKVQLHYHPVILGHERRIAFHEVLSRVPSDTGELFTAATFLPMAHRVGLLVAFDRQVCDRVIKGMIFGPQQTNLVSINLSSDAVNDQTFRQWLLEHVAENHLLAERLIFEVGENVASHMNTNVLGFLEALNRCGCSLLVEHVGQPQYSASYLRPGLFQFVKLHRSLTREIERDNAIQDFVRGLAAVIHANGATVLAENVETEAQWNTLLSLGVHGGQGYLFGVPSSTIVSSVARSA